MMTTEQLSRVTCDYSRMCGETVQVEQINQTVYIFCSELASLRLFRQCHGMYEARQAYSVGRGTHFFAFDLRF